MKDNYINLINEQWHHIAIIYNEFNDKKPIIEYLVNSGKLLSYPAKDYINSLSVRTRDQTNNILMHVKRINFCYLLKTKKNKS